MAYSTLNALLSSINNSSIQRYQSGGKVSPNISISSEALDTSNFEKFTDTVVWDIDKKGNKINPSYGFGFLIHEGPPKKGVDYSKYTSNDGIIINGKADKNKATVELNKRVSNSTKEISRWYNKKYGKGEFDKIPSNIKKTLGDLTYNMGVTDFKNQKKFPQFWKELSSGEYSKAADELRYHSPIYDTQGNVISSKYSKYWEDVGSHRWDEQTKGLTEILHVDGIQLQDMSENRGWNAWYNLKNPTVPSPPIINPIPGGTNPSVTPF